MTAVRKQVRHAIRDRLLAGATLAADRVFTNRAEAYVHRFDADERGEAFPSISVNSASEDSRRIEVNGLSHTMEADIDIELILAPFDGIASDDQFDDLAEEVLRLVLSDPKAGGLARRVEYRGMVFGRESQGVTDLGVGVLQFRYEYDLDVAQAVPPANETDLTGASISVDSGGDPLVEGDYQAP